MAIQNFTSGVASAVGSNLANAVLTTPQGHAAVVATAAVAVAAAPAIAIGVACGAVCATIGCGTLYLGSKVSEWWNSY